MKKITLKLLLISGLIVMVQSCQPDDSSLIDGLPDSIINTDYDGAPPRGLTEDWSNHEEVLSRQILTGTVGIYYDPEVDREIEWPLDLYSKVWSEVLSTYGRYGEPSNLYVVGHGEDKSTFAGTYLEGDSGNRNIIDFPILNTEFSSQTSDISLGLLSQIVESGYGSTKGSPASNVWQDKFSEIFIYDMYLRLDMEAEAERVKATFSATSANFPVSESYWFRDWFLPIYENYNGSSTLNGFFKVVSDNYPVDGNEYAKEMNVGEFVHFFSGATGDDLQPFFEDAFGWNDDWAMELLVAQAQFPTLNYPFEPASELKDVTAEANATIVVSKDNDGGPDAAEGSLKLIDNDISTKFLTGGFPQDFYMQQNFETAQVVNKYSLVSGNDAPPRDYKSWELLGSNDGANFTLLDTRSGEIFNDRQQKKEYNFDNETAYKYYRLNLLENNGSSLIQLSEWRLLNLEVLSFGPEDVTADATTTVSRDNGGPDGNEGSGKVTDGDIGSKFLLFNWEGPEWIQQEFAEPLRVTKYTLTSGNDAPGRDPVSWTLSGSNDGINFIELDSRTDQSFESRGQTREFLVSNEDSYTYYRLDILTNGGDSLFQLAEWRLFAE